MPILAEKYNVSVRTIKRDIDELGCIIPIITRQGRFGGGIGIMDDYSWDRCYMSKEDIELLKEIRKIAVKGEKLVFNENRLGRLNKIIEIYETPEIKKNF